MVLCDLKKASPSQTKKMHSMPMMVENIIMHDRANQTNPRQI